MKIAILRIVFVIFSISTLCVAQRNDSLILGTINSCSFTQREAALCKRYYIPLTTVNSLNTNTVAEFKIQQQLALELGLLKDISYKSFYQGFLNENQRRKEAQSQNKVFYGPVQFTEDTYFSYYISNLILGIKSELLKSRLKIDEHQLQRLYKQNKEKLYKIPDIILCLRAEVRSDDNDSTCRNLVLKNLAKSLKISNSITIDNPFPGKVKIIVEYLDFNPETDNMLEKERYYQFAVLTENLKTGEIITRKTNSGTYEIIKIINRKKSGYRSFEAVKNALISLEKDRQYAEYIRFLLKRSIIVQF